MMKKAFVPNVVLIGCLTLVNISICTSPLVSADIGEHYPYLASDEVVIQALGYLRNRQMYDGCIGGFSVSSWAAMAIAASGNDPNSWGDLVEYLRENTNLVDETKATDWERQILAIVACGEDPRDFGGIDHVTKVECFFDGVQIGSRANLYDDFFGILALVAGGVKRDSFMIQAISTYIKEKQRKDGGWGDVDATAAAVMALSIAGEHNASRCIQNALTFIKSEQTENGGFQSWGTTNTASTAWAVLAIVASGQTPTSSEWKCHGRSPIDFLLYMQQENGAFNWSANQHTSPEWMTSYVIPALLGKPYPVEIFPSTGEHNNHNGIEEKEDESDIHLNGWRGNIRIEGKTRTIWGGEVCVNDSTIPALNESSGEIETYYIPYPSVLGALNEAASQGGFTYHAIYYPNWDAFFVKTIGDDSDWWHYWVDYTLPMVGADMYELSERNEEILWGYLEEWRSQALRISVNKDTVKVHKEFTARVFNETLVNVENAVVVVDSSEYLTDEQGNVTIRIDTAGNYDIYAEKEGYVRSEKVTVHVKKSVEIVKPRDNTVYLLNRDTQIPCSVIFILGYIDIKVKTTDAIDKVEFYIDDELEFIDIEQPFEWRLNKRAFLKKVTIKIKASASVDDVFCIIQPFMKYIESLSEHHHFTHVLNVIQSHLKNLEISLLDQNEVEERDVLIFNLFPSMHVL